MIIKAISQASLKIFGKRGHDTIILFERRKSIGHQVSCEIILKGFVRIQLCDSDCNTGAALEFKFHGAKGIKMTKIGAKI